MKERTKEASSRNKIQWIDPSWLEDHLDDGMVILDCQPDIHDFILEHVPGAEYLNENIFRLSLNGMPGGYISPEAAQMHIRRLGVRNDSPAVSYTHLTLPTN